MLLGEAGAGVEVMKPGGLLGEYRVPPEGGLGLNLEETLCKGWRDSQRGRKRTRSLGRWRHRAQGDNML